jgi:photosystem II stability/assembly factor-like uncharacterized protein
MRKHWVRESAAMLLIVSATASLQALPAGAANDPLELPARMSSKAAQSILPAIAHAGNRLIAVGERGIIVFSDDNGKNWSQAAVPVSVTLTAVHFVSTDKGWAVGHDGVILSSADGGKTWVKQFDGNLANAQVLAAAEEAARAAAGPALEKAAIALEDVKAGVKFGPSRPLLGVWFKNENEGYAVGAFGQIFHTTNGGLRWELWSSRLNNPESLHYNAFSRTPRGTLTVAGEGGKVYRSADDGATWQTSDTGYKGHLYGVLGAVNANSGEDLVAFGFGGHVFRSADDGKTWHEIASGVTKSLIGGTSLPDGGMLLAAQDGGILRSDDQGRSFRVIVSGGRLSIAGMARVGNTAQLALAGIGGVHIVSTNASAKGAQP